MNVLSHGDLLREVGTIELALAWAIEYHEKKAQMNAAGQATWKVEYPPICKELRDAQSAAIVLRQQITQVKQFSEKIQSAFEDIKAPPNRNGFSPMTPAGLRNQYAKNLL
jgi:hypothetical protein